MPLLHGLPLLPLLLPLLLLIILPTSTAASTAVSTTATPAPHTTAAPPALPTPHLADHFRSIEHHHDPTGQELFGKNFSVSDPKTNILYATLRLTSDIYVTNITHDATTGVYSE